MSKTAARPDKNGIYPQNYWDWVQRQYGVLRFLNVIGIKMYPKYDPGTKRGRNAIENNLWGLDRMSPISVTWKRARGPRLGWNSAQFGSVYDAVAMVLEHLRLARADFTMPPVAGRTVYPQGGDLLGVQQVKEGGRREPVDPLPIMADRTNERVVDNLLTSRVFDEIHREYHTKSLTKSGQCQGDAGRMERDVIEALAPLRHEQLERPFSVILNEGSTAVTSDPGAPDPAALTQEAPDEPPKEEPPAPPNGVGDDPISSYVDGMQKDLLETRTLIQQERDAVRRAEREVQRLQKENADSEDRLKLLEDRERRLDTALTALDLNRSVRSLAVVLDEAEPEGAVPILGKND